MRHRPFFLQPLSVSYVSQRQEAVLSRLSVHTDAEGTPLVVVLSKRMTSVMETLLPPFYGFAVLDGKGNVLFHDQEDRINNENFLEEIGSHGSSRAALHNNHSLKEKASYWGEPIRYYLTPHSTMPVYVVTYLRLGNAQLVVSEIMTLCLILFFAGFLVMCVATYGTVFLSRPGGQFIRIKQFDFSWMMPAPACATATSCSCS